MNHDLQHKTALITGASRGLGLRIAHHFWQRGANLILVARSADPLQALRATLLASASKEQTIDIMVVDLATPCAVAELMECHYFKHVDILVNNAAVQQPIGPAWDTDWQAWQDTLQINLLAPIALCRAVVPYMIQRAYGKIINLSGGGATTSRPNFSAYAVAKAGLVRFSETLAEEVSAFHIAVNCIAPGTLNTDMLAQVIQAGESRAGQKEYALAQEKMQSDADLIENAAELCGFLASSASEGITGKLISAVWDPWRNMPDFLEELKNSDIYTLRRIVPKDRGKSWGGIS